MTGSAIHAAHGRTWVALTLALAVHVAREAARDFLSVYHPAVRAIRDAVPLLPLPEFDLGPRLAGLCAGIPLLPAASRAVFRGRRRTIAVSCALSPLMAGNALGHLIVTAWARNAKPGVYPSPPLLAAPAWLFVSARRASR